MERTLSFSCRQNLLQRPASAAAQGLLETTSCYFKLERWCLPPSRAEKPGPDGFFSDMDGFFATEGGRFFTPPSGR